MSVHLEHYRGNEEFVKRLYDQIDLMQRRKRILRTPFFSPEESAICESILGKHIAYSKDGGYEGAERCRFALQPIAEDMDMQIVALKATYSTQFSILSHRDVLGAIMNLGIEREKTGDLLVQDGSVIIFVDRDIENYITCNLTKIKRCNVHFKPYTQEVTYEANILYEQKIVSSLRLDTLVTAFTKVSRKKAQDMIVGGFVKVNHVVLEQNNYLCNNNSAISIRGYGRFLYKETLKKTKKDHFIIEIGKYQ